MTESIVNIEVEDLKRVELVRVSGRIDSSNAAQFDSVLKEVAGRKHNVVLEMNGVDYISSAGLRVIERAAARARSAGGALLVCGLQEPVRVSLVVSGAAEKLDIADSVTQAIGRLGQSPDTF